MALTGCKADTQPRLGEAPAGSFVLYEPALNNYTYYLTKNGTISLVTNGQPDYGVGTPTKYEVQVSLTDKWTVEVDEEVVDEETGDILVKADYAKLRTVNTQSKIDVKSNELSIAICTLMGIREGAVEEDWPMHEMPVYVRVRAYIADPSAEGGYVPYSQIFSNTITLKSVLPYFVVPMPAEIYCIGDYQGWNIAGNEQTLTLSEEENGIGSDIYTGYLNMTAQQASNGFRFYKEIAPDGWGNDGDFPSIGATANDNDNVDVELEDGAAEGECFKGKGNWKITNFEGGWFKATIDLNEMTYKFEAAPDYDPAAAN